MRQPTYADISALAYQLYLEDGKPEGQSEYHWLRAENILRHPENFSAENILSPPSEPEINRTLDAKAQILDSDLPSDPHSGPKAYHQHVDIAAEKRTVATIKKALQGMPGIEDIAKGPETATIRITFDARRTNPSAIVDLLTPAPRVTTPAKKKPASGLSRRA